MREYAKISPNFWQRSLIEMLHEHALMNAIRYVGSKQALARALNLRPNRIHHWLNRNMRIPFEYAIAIETLTKGRVNRYDIAPYAWPLAKLHTNYYQEIGHK